MIRTYFKTALRNIRYQKVTSILNIAGLAISMWAAILILIWVQNEISYDSFYKDADNIYLIKNYIGADKEDVTVWENSPYLLGEKVQEQVPGVLKVARIAPDKYPGPYVNQNGEFIKEERAAYVDSSWFDLFDHRLLAGSFKAFNSNPYSVLLTESNAKKYFGDAKKAIGQSLRIDTIDYKIQGILADNPANTSFTFDLYRPLAAAMQTTEAKKELLYWSNYNYLTFVKLQPATDVAQVEKKMSSIILTERKRESNDLKAGLVSLPAIHFDKSIENPDMPRGNKKTVAIFTILGILLVVIACINYINLTTARTTLRLKEVSIRKIIGAERIQIFFQLVTESFLISFFALLIALVGIAISLPYFNQFTEKQFVISAYSTQIWAILGLILVFSVLLSSVYPALLLSSFKPIAIFRGQSIFNLKNVYIRKSLVVAQFTLSIGLIVASLVIFRQMQFVNAQSSIDNKAQFFSFNLPFKIYRLYKGKERAQFQELLKQKLKNESSVEEVFRTNGGSVIDMNSWSSGDNSDWDGRPAGFEPKISFFDADINLKTLLNLKVVQGSWFKEGTGNKNDCILNETAVRELNIRQPVIGQRFVARGDTGVIVGVVNDFVYKNLHEKINPVVIRNASEMSNTYIVKAAPGRAMDARNAAEKIWNEFFPADPFSYSFLNDEYEAMYRSEQKIMVLVTLFSLLAVLISCLGLFGLAAFTAERRKKEIGIRKVVGASVTDIVTIISKEFIALVIVAFVIATPLAWYMMNSWLGDFAYRINIVWWFFAAAGLISLLIAFLTMSYHSIKAALNNPVNSLRTE
ncbi:MAG: ABC transporter permease [Ferruginibacter sp.]